MGKQLDFERDPALRDKGIGIAPPVSLFQQMLDKTEATNKQSKAQPADAVQLKSQPADSLKTKPASTSPANWVIAILIVLLIGLILFLLFKHY